MAKDQIRFDAALTALNNWVVEYCEEKYDIYNCPYVYIDPQGDL